MLAGVVVHRITAWLVRLVRAWLRWVDPPTDSIYVAAAKPLIAAWEQRLGPGFGEAKRHQVYAALIDQFPQVSKRVLSRAIEDALE